MLAVAELDQLDQPAWRLGMGACNIYKAKTILSALVNKAAAGEEVVIARAGKPMVKMVPIVPLPATSTAKPKY